MHNTHYTNIDSMVILPLANGSEFVLIILIHLAITKIHQTRCRSKNAKLENVSTCFNMSYCLLILNA